MKEASNPHNVRESADEKPPRYVLVQDVAKKLGDAYVTGSLFEAKAGVRVSTQLPVVDEDPVGGILSLPMTRTIRKSIDKHLLDNMWGVAPYLDAGKKKKVEKFLKKAYDATLFTSLSLPDADWAKKVFGMEYFGMKEYFVNIGATPFGCMEARLVLSGEEAMMGVAYEKIPGDDFKHKRNWLWTASVEQLEIAIKDSGFYVVNKPPQLLVVPSGFMTSSFSEGGAFGVRWSLSSDASDTTRVRYMLQQLLSSHPEMRGPSLGFSSFLAFLGTD